VLIHSFDAGDFALSFKVLIVEDYQDTREMIKFMLQTQGYSVVEAENGLDAIEIARRERPDAVLMDMSLPTLDGDQVTRRLRSYPELRNVPIIACTAYNQWEWRMKALLAGCTEFLTKPVDFDRLNALLARYAASDVA
jgi:CheY-like chemotaxis protein